ncbi:MAG: OmpA family protein [Bacteroidetes bacterium]|nr:OmpA family protein [Bacteroidota bacterium]
MRIYATIIFVFITRQFFSQNLVRNPGFEEKDSVYYFGAKYWSVPTAGTTDFFNVPDSRDLNFFGGRTKANTGNGFAGFIPYEYATHQDNYREFTTGELTEALKAGQTYPVSFYLQLGKKCRYSVAELQIWFSKTKPEKTLGPNPTKEKPQMEFNIKPANATQGNWVEISGSYTATGGEKYFTIGNFLSDKNSTMVKMHVPVKGSHEWAYYYMDDFSIGDTAITEIPNDNAIWKPDLDTTKLNVAVPLDIAAGKRIIGQNIYFENDKAVLLPESYPLLDQIIAAMKDQPQLKVEIDGFTDANGTPEHNMMLSADRANTVAGYFFSHGIDKNRMTAKGFGSTRPVADEGTDEGRSKNRRVEFVFSE